MGFFGNPWDGYSWDDPRSNPRNWTSGKTGDQYIGPNPKWTPRELTPEEILLEQQRLRAGLRLAEELRTAQLEIRNSLKNTRRALLNAGFKTSKFQENPAGDKKDILEIIDEFRNSFIFLSGFEHSKGLVPNGIRSYQSEILELLAENGIELTKEEKEFLEQHREKYTSAWKERERLDKEYSELQVLLATCLQNLQNLDNQKNLCNAVNVIIDGLKAYALHTNSAFSIPSADLLKNELSITLKRYFPSLNKNDQKTILKVIKNMDREFKHSIDFKLRSLNLQDIKLWWLTTSKTRLAGNAVSTTFKATSLAAVGFVGAIFIGHKPTIVPSQEILPRASNRPSTSTVVVVLDQNGECSFSDQNLLPLDPSETVILNRNGELRIAALKQTSIQYKQDASFPAPDLTKTFDVPNEENDLYLTFDKGLLPVIGKNTPYETLTCINTTTGEKGQTIGIELGK